MATTNGYIFVWRQLRDNPIYTNSKAVHVWIECLMRASYKKQEKYIKREKVKLEPGQFVMGREEFGEKIGMSGSTAWYWLQEFEVNSMVDIKTTPKGTIVTIKNWGKYQDPDSTSDSKKTADKQQKNTIKKEKKLKKVKNIYNYWREKSETITHRKLTTPMKKSVKARLKNYTVDELKEAIDNYNMVVKSDDYFFNYDNWSLNEFLSRGEGEQVEKFLESPDAYLKDDKGSGKNKSKRRHSTLTEEEKEDLGL